MSGRTSRATACCGVALVWPLLASAAGPLDALPALPPTVVTASRLPQPLDSSTADVQVIDESTIRGAGANSLAELLNLHAGIDIAVAGGPGQTSSVFLRGTNSNHVLVLIDGIRVGSATSGTTARSAG
jgi:vitamin B12 transporter